jgi:hypothetical protein
VLGQQGGDTESYITGSGDGNFFIHNFVICILSERTGHRDNRVLF